MSAFLDGLSLFVVGVAVGWFLNPMVVIAKKIWSEAKKAKEEW